MNVLFTILWFLGCRNIPETAEIMELSLDPGIDIYICGDEAVGKKIIENSVKLYRLIQKRFDV